MPGRAAATACQATATARGAMPDMATAIPFVRYRAVIPGERRATLAHRSPGVRHCAPAAAGSHRASGVASAASRRSRRFSRRPSTIV
ncbi:hypothetical protein Asera_38670 [Actinocatenispora sera]|uniref:Uncharacterized protein n=1 Tax=Actinocatenispora sera TaxID=390989 RepID=A0A810L442_9ACTN|nr:hypothetical protein Asera_38670 [Actinocatenispora sera]